MRLRVFILWCQLFLTTSAVLEYPGWRVCRLSMSDWSPIVPCEPKLEVQSSALQKRGEIRLLWLKKAFQPFLRKVDLEQAKWSGR